MFIRATLKSTACFQYWTEHTQIHATLRPANNSLQGILLLWFTERDTHDWWVKAEECTGASLEKLEELNGVFTLIHTK